MGRPFLRTFCRTDKTFPEKRPAGFGEGERGEHASAVTVQLRLSMAAEPVVAHHRDTEVISPFVGRARLRRAANLSDARRLDRVSPYRLSLPIRPTVRRAIAGIA